MSEAKSFPSEKFPGIRTIHHGNSWRSDEFALPDGTRMAAPAFPTEELAAHGVDRLYRCAWQDKEGNMPAGYKDLVSELMTPEVKASLVGKSVETMKEELRVEAQVARADTTQSGIQFVSQYTSVYGVKSYMAHLIHPRTKKQVNGKTCFSEAEYGTNAKWLAAREADQFLALWHGSDPTGRRWCRDPQDYVKDEDPVLRQAAIDRIAGRCTTGVFGPYVDGRSAEGKRAKALAEGTAHKPPGATRGKRIFDEMKKTLPLDRLIDLIPAARGPVRSPSTGRRVAAASAAVEAPVAGSDAALLQAAALLPEAAATGAQAALLAAAAWVMEAAADAAAPEAEAALLAAAGRLRNSIKLDATALATADGLSALQKAATALVVASRGAGVTAGAAAALETAAEAIAAPVPTIEEQAEQLSLDKIIEMVAARLLRTHSSGYLRLNANAISKGHLLRGFTLQEQSFDVDARVMAAALVKRILRERAMTRRELAVLLLTPGGLHVDHRIAIPAVDIRNLDEVETWLSVANLDLVPAQANLRKGGGPFQAVELESETVIVNRTTNTALGEAQMQEYHDLKRQVASWKSVLGDVAHELKQKGNVGVKTATPNDLMRSRLNPLISAVAMGVSRFVSETRSGSAISKKLVPDAMREGSARAPVTHRQVFSTPRSPAAAALSAAEEFSGDEDEDSGVQQQLQEEDAPAEGAHVPVPGFNGIEGIVNSIVASAFPASAAARAPAPAPTLTTVPIAYMAYLICESVGMLLTADMGTSGTAMRQLAKKYCDHVGAKLRPATDAELDRAEDILDCVIGAAVAAAERGDLLTKALDGGMFPESAVTAEDGRRTYAHECAKAVQAELKIISASVEE